MLSESDFNQSILFQEKNLTYLDFFIHLKKIEPYFKSLNLQEGSILLSLLPTGLDFFILFLLCLKNKIIFFPNCPHLNESQINHLKNEIPFVIIIKSLDELKKKEIDQFFFSSLSLSLSLSSSSSLSPYEDYKQLFTLSLNQEALIIMTSGSSNTPKGVLHTLKSIYYSAMGTLRFYQVTKNDSWSLALPTFHVGGIMIFIRMFLIGGSVLLQNKKPSSEWLKQFENQTSFPNLFSFVPTQIIEIFELEKSHPKIKDKIIEKLKMAKAILLGGDKTPNWLINKMIDEKLPVYLTYGMTETCSQITSSSIALSIISKNNLNPNTYNTFVHAQTVLPFRRVLIGSKNEILVKGKTLLKTYLSSTQPKHNIDQDPLNIFYTKDLGRLINKKLLIDGRSDQSFISKGEIINPLKIENLISEMDYFLWYFILDQDHEIFGSIPIFTYQLKNTYLSQEKKILTEVYHLFKKKLAPFELPSQFISINSLSSLENKSLKVSRALIKKNYHSIGIYKNIDF